MTRTLWAVLLALQVAAVVNADGAVSTVRDHFCQRGPVGPDGLRASRSYPEHGPELVFDKPNNTCWGPKVNRSGAGEWIEARFDQPTRLLDVIITSGVSTRAEQLRESALPRRVEAVITTPDGTKEPVFRTLDQAAGSPAPGLPRRGEVTAVRLIVRSPHAASADKQVASAEVELFGPSHGGTSRWLRTFRRAEREPTGDHPGWRRRPGRDHGPVPPPPPRSTPAYAVVLACSSSTAPGQRIRPDGVSHRGPEGREPVRGRASGRPGGRPRRAACRPVPFATP
ncbi:NADase-type glycan-binding domain-containing protein [Streptomyces galbus]|uniref:NADase-type glycan-binding domain-containing protein n=1 Tax=Streptomyces galbus TaxID=33898 RepID=UPI0038297FE9